MSELEPLNKINFSIENIPIIFENQRTNLRKDILFLKEDILKDFRQIETKLSTKYEKQNTSILTRLHKFENNIEAMNNKISELSNLISTDKNIQQKIANLYDFKIKVSDSLLNQELAIKANESIIKEAIDKYDSLFSDSVLYPGIIGSNGRFKTFHNFIDYILKNMSEFINFKEKNIIDYKGYKTKLEGLFKSLTRQAESIINSSNKYTNNRINELEKKMKELIIAEGTKFSDLRFENNKVGLDLENKIDEINKDIKYIRETKINLNEKNEEEINLLKDFNKGVTIKFENCESEINSIKNKFNNLEEFIQTDTKYKVKKGEKKQKKDNNLDLNNILISTKRHRLSNRNSISNINNNYNKSMRRGTIVKSIIKQYIKGKIGINEIESSSKRQKSINLGENEIKKIDDNFNESKKNNKNLSLDNISKVKRMTYGPEKFMNIHKLDKNFINKFIDVNSEKSIYNKSNNSISEEKSEDVDYINSFKDKTEINKSKIKENNQKKDKISGLLYEKVDKNNEINEFINKDKFKEAAKIIMLNSKKINEINSGTQTDNLKINKKDNKNNNIDIKRQRININYIKNENSKNKRNNSGRNYRTLSYEKISIESSNSFPKFTNSAIDIKKQPKIINQKQMSAVGKLCNIGGNIDIINYSKTNTNKKNKKNILFYDNNQINLNNNINIINNYHNYNNLKKRIMKKQLNIIELNFDEGNPLVKEKDELKKLIKKIKENRANFFFERNNRPFDKNKEYKKFHSRDSDLGVENNSMNVTPMNNNSSKHFFNNKIIKEELQNINSFGYLNYIKNNKKVLNTQKMNLNKKNNSYSNLID